MKMNFKRIRKTILLNISVISLMGSMIPLTTYATPTTLNTSVDVFKIVGKGYNSGTLGPISITPIKITKSGSNNVSGYLVCMSGTEHVTNQSTYLVTDFKSGFEQNSPYLTAVINAINSNIPKGSNLILAGHSLGGMIAEQASGNSAVKNNYNILNVVTFGSPLVNPFGREGTIKRLGDKKDPVPYMSASGTYLAPWQIGGLNVEDGGYTDVVKSHTQSYSRTDEWGAYDTVGIKYGTTHLNLDTNNTKFYHAPTN